MRRPNRAMPSRALARERILLVLLILSWAIAWPVLLDSCRLQWDERTRGILRAWSQRHSAPVVALRWESQTGVSSRLTDRMDPGLRRQVLALLETDTPEGLDRALLAIVRRIP